MRVRALIIDPVQGSTLQPSEIQFSGVGWSSHGAVSRVEISFDDGKRWFKVNLESPTNQYRAQRWYYLWKPESPGQYKITVRASDSYGDTQPLAPRWNQGGYGNNNAQQVRVSIE